MRRRIAISALSLLALATIGCGQATPSPTTAPVATVSAAEPTPWTVSTGGISPDMEVYSSIEELSAASDLVILGTVEGVAAREVDYGTADPDEREGRGIPTVFYEVAVTETLRGKAEATVIVSAPDVDQVSMGEEATAVRSGQQVLLFLREQTTEDAPGITAYDHFYVTVSLDNGVFDRSGGDLVVPRMPELFNDATFDLAGVRRAVQWFDESPLATWDPSTAEAFNQAGAGEGTLDISSGCVRMILENRKSILLVWPEPTSWNASTQTIEFVDVFGERLELREGDRIMPGGSTATHEPRFVSPPSPSCKMDEAFVLNSVRLVLRSDSNASSSIPDYDLSPYNSNVWFVPPPANMDDFVSKMDAIVVARVTSVIGSGELNSYNEQDNVRNIKKGDPVSSALPATDYNLTIERVILGENIEAGGSITLRVLGEADHVSPYPSLISMPQINDRRIHGLGRNPDRTYGAYSWWSVFLIDGDRVTHVDDLRQKVLFANNTETNQFVRELESAVSRRNR